MAKAVLPERALRLWDARKVRLLDFDHEDDKRLGVAHATISIATKPFSFR